jgi:predicted nucleic acid-binding Zn ribbon protein
MNCSNCQNPIQDGEKFCGKCGAILNADKKWFKILWIFLVVLDAISMAPVALFLFTAFLFGGDTGGRNLILTLILVPLFSFVIFAAYIFNFILFIKKNKKIGIPLAIILAMPIFYFGIMIVQGKKENAQFMDYNTCIKIEGQKKYPETESGWNEKRKKDFLEFHAICKEKAGYKK